MGWSVYPRTAHSHYVDYDSKKLSPPLIVAFEILVVKSPLGKLATISSPLISLSSSYNWASKSVAFLSGGEILSITISNTMHGSKVLLLLCPAP